MQFVNSSLYHIYNRGNNKQPIFFTGENYLYFLRKVKRNIYPYCDILAWCLMPNHFHFLIHANENSIQTVKETPIKIDALTEGFRLLLSSYAQGINKQNNRTGNLFQQKTKFKCINDGNIDYGYTTFQYIHQNPLKAGLANKLEDWEFSSFCDYAELRNGILCNKQLANSLLGLDTTSFPKESYDVLPEEIIKKIV